MYTLEMATAKAIDYLHKQGIQSVQLAEVIQQGQKWVVTYQLSLPFIKPERFTVEIDSQNGNVIGYNRYAA